MTWVRLVAAGLLCAGTLLLAPTFTSYELQALWQALPELTLGSLALGTLPVVVGLANLYRWLRPRAVSRDGALAVATRSAALLALIGLLLPLHADEPLPAQLLLRGVQLVLLLMMIDGGFRPKG